MGRRPIHPGEHLALELNGLRMSAAELARQIEVPVNRITAIINGDRGVTADTALRLGHWFGTTAEFWFNLQTLYELRLARQEVGERVRKLPTLTDRKHKRESTSNRLWCGDSKGRGRKLAACSSPTYACGFLRKRKSQQGLPSMIVPVRINSTLGSNLAAIA